SNAQMDWARIQSERAMLRRELGLVQDQLADMEAHLRQFEPILRGGSLMLSGLRLMARLAILPIHAVAMLATVPALAKRLKEARLRSQRLFKDRRQVSWTSKVDGRAYLWNAIRAIGLSRPTIYRVTPQQRISLLHRPRILHVIPNVWAGGSTQLILDLQYYLGHRFDMKVVPSALPPQGRHQGMKISVVARPPSRLEVRRVFTSFNPHIVHIHYWGDVDEPWYKAF